MCFLDINRSGLRPYPVIYVVAITVRGLPAEKIRGTSIQLQREHKNKNKAKTTKTNEKNNKGLKNIDQKRIPGSRWDAETPREPTNKIKTDVPGMAMIAYAQRARNTKKDTHSR